MMVDESFMIEDLEKTKFVVEKIRLKALRKKQIEYEWNLFKWFCRLNNIKMCEFSSLVAFQNYCKENLIQLI